MSCIKSYISCLFCLCNWSKRGQIHLKGCPTSDYLHVSSQSCPTLYNTKDCSPPGSSVHGILQARILEGAVMPSSRGSSQPRIEPRSPTLQEDSLPSKPPGNPKNTGVGSLFLLQGIFPTQGSNAGLLHCKWSLYWLSHQGSPPTLPILLQTHYFKFSLQQMAPKGLKKLAFTQTPLWTSLSPLSCLPAKYITWSAHAHQHHQTPTRKSILLGKRGDSKTLT